jgi:hypothetical protein
VFRIFQQFVILRRATARLSIGLEAESLRRADVILPWAGFGLTGLAWIGSAVWFGAILWSTFSEQALNEDVLAAAASALLGLSGLGASLALAALLARYRFRVVSILSVLGAVLCLAGFAALVIVGSQS